VGGIDLNEQLTPTPAAPSSCAQRDSMTPASTTRSAIVPSSSEPRPAGSVGLEGLTSKRLRSPGLLRLSRPPAYPPLSSASRRPPASGAIHAIHSPLSAAV